MSKLHLKNDVNPGKQEVQKVWQLKCDELFLAKGLG